MDVHLYPILQETGQFLGPDQIGRGVDGEGAGHSGAQVHLEALGRRDHEVAKFHGVFLVIVVEGRKSASTRVAVDGGGCGERRVAVHGPDKHVA